MHKISGYTKISGVIGDGISYTKSPFIHNYWYDYYNIDGAYVCFQNTSQYFKDSVLGLFHAGIIGLNVTVPFKELAYELADIKTTEAHHAGAVNCLIKRDNQIIGHNTDGVGFYNALRFLDSNLDLNNKEVLVIGAGGAASAIIAYLSQFNVSISLLNRTIEKAQVLADKFPSTTKVVSCHHVADIIIQTTNVKKIENGNILDIPNNILEKAKYVLDINYGKESGDFLKRTADLGIKNCDGLEMLLQQATPSFKLFNNQEVDITDDLRKRLKII